MDDPFTFPNSKIKEEDDLSDVIDLDMVKTSEDLVYEWDSKVRMKIKNYFIVDEEQSLDTLMKWYIQSIKEVETLEDFSILKVLTTKHIQFFKLYFVELNCCFVDNYLDNMEEILSFYANLEVKSLPARTKDMNRRACKKLVTSVCQKIIFMLSFYLLNRQDRIYHAVMKMKMNSLTEDSKSLLKRIFGKLLNEDPSDKSDLGFCRAYIICQKWKMVSKEKDWERIDDIVYNLYNRTPESVKASETLTQILLPQNNSVVDILIHINEKHVIITEEYFKFIKSKKSQEDTLVLSEISNIEIGDQILPDLMDNSEDGEFDKAYQNFVKTMSSLSQGSSDTIFDGVATVKREDEDDDCQIVAVSSLGYEAENTELVHELLDDDDIEIIYFKKKEQNTMAQKDKEKPELSFLDSIDIRDPSDIPTEKVSSLNTTLLPSRSRKVVTTWTNTSPHSPKRNSPRPGCHLEVDMSISNASKNSTVMEISELSIPSNSGIKSVTNMETQTDFDSVKKVDNLNVLDKSKDSKAGCYCTEENITKPQTSEKPVEDCDSMSYYHYGLVTPPSDQPLDEHAPPTGSNVYAKIVRTHDGPDDNMSKVLDYLPSSVEEANMESNSESLPNSCEIDGAADLMSPPTKENNMEGQCTSHSDDANLSSDMEFEPSIEPNAKKKHDLDIDVDFADARLNICGEGFQRLNITEEKIGDVVGPNQDTSKNLNVNSSSDDHNPNLTSKSCSNEEAVIENLPNPSPTDTNISCTLSDTGTLSSNTTIGSDIVPLQSPCSNDGDVFKMPTSSASSLCTSTDIVPLQDTSSKSSGQSGNRNLSCPSPDITSTSTDIQDFHESFSAHSGDDHENFCYDVSENEEQYLDSENQCSEEYIEYSECNGDSEDFANNENVSQSNLDDGEGEGEIFIEETVLMNNGEEFSFIIDETLPVGANVCVDSHFSESSVHNEYPVPVNDGESNEIAREKSHVTDNGSTENKKLDSSPRKIMFTCSEKVERPTADEFSRFQETIHLRWSKLKEKYDVDEIFSGPVSKVNGVSSCVNPDKNFDLFNSKATPSVQETSLQVPSNSSGNSSGELKSPEYEDIGDDLRTYFEENKNSDMLGLSSVQNKSIPVERKSCNSTTSLGNNGLHYPKDDKIKKTVQIFPRPLESLQRDEAHINSSTFMDAASKNGTSKIKPPKNGKRTRIAFAEHVIDTSNIVSHSPTGTTKDVLQGILKKSPSSSETTRQSGKRTTRPLTPRRSTSSKSHSQHKVRPTDKYLLKPLSVRVDRLSAGQIARYLNMNEISREVKMQKEKQKQSRIFRVDYDKQTTHINENDLVMYNTPEGIPHISRLVGHWDPTVQSKRDGLDEGMVEITPSTNINDNDYSSSLGQCENSYCSTQNETILNLSDPNPNFEYFVTSPHPPKPNPFLLESNDPMVCNAQEPPVYGKSKHNYSDIANLMQSDNAYSSNESNANSSFQCKFKIISNSIVDLNQSNFENDASLNLNRQPAVVPQKEQFEKAVEEIGRALDKMCRSQEEPPVYGKSKHNYSDIANLIQSNNAYGTNGITVGGNFGCKYNDIPNNSLNLNQGDFQHEANLNRQPALVPGGREFNSTVEVSGDTSPIPASLYNLDLSEFSSSPLDCFRSPAGSPSNTFLSDACRIEKVPVLENFDPKSHLYDNIGAFVDSSENSANNVNTRIPDVDVKNSTKISQYNTELGYNFKSESDVKHVLPEVADVKAIVKTKDEPSELSGAKQDTKLDIFAKLDVLETEAETRLPLKKRKLSVAQTKDEMTDNDDDDIIGPDLVEEIIKRARAEEVEKEDISYPAKPMISIAEIQEKLAEPLPRVFKTPAELKEMPAASSAKYNIPSDSSRIVTEQYNNHTYNNPTINYHMNNVPYPFFPCGSLPYFPPILLPINSTTTFDMNLVNAKQQGTPQQSTSGQEPRKERRRRERKKK